MIPHIVLPLPRGVLALSTLRGRCDEGPDPYDGFNTCDYTGDDSAHVEDCRARLALMLGTDAAHIAIPRQTHSSRVAVIESTDASGDYFMSALDGTDALVTAKPGIALCVHTADCVPGVLYDPVAGVTGVFHSGWRGTVGRIAARTVEAMTALGAVPEHIHVALGPAICAECFEVGREVAYLFGDFGTGVVREGADRPHIDLRLAVVDTLRRAGVPEAQIHADSPCPRCRPDDFFSARRVGVSSGRTLTMVMRLVR